jgi:dTDP-glucose 4,6-dehydratase
MAYRKEHGLQTRIVRIFNTFGPRMRLRDGRVVPSFIGSALSGKPLAIHGDGAQTRSFCYVSDLVEGIYRLMMCTDRSAWSPTNIGNPREMTIREFAQEILRLTGSRSRIVHKAAPQDDPKQRRPDVSRARKLLKWSPEVGLAQGLQLTIDYFCGQMKGQPV